MTMRIGCVGCGNMGGAILAGLARSAGQGQTDAYALCGYNRTASRMQTLEQAGVRVMPSPLAVAENADIILLAVKPYQIREITEQILPALSKNKVIVSVAAGITLQSLQYWASTICWYIVIHTSIYTNIIPTKWFGYQQILSNSLGQQKTRKPLKVAGQSYFVKRL